MGAVYVAQQLSTGRRRALKLLLPSLVQSERSRERFEQEARVASQIASDHVVEVVSAGVDSASGAPWLAMELLEGETLADRLARAGPLRPPETLEVMRQLCHALGAAHATGLVHRDIKPENLFLAHPRREGVPFTLKILDFGIAKLTEDVRGQGGITGAIGSPLWMAPEQASATGIGPTADVWALGLVVFQCLTGQHYWRSATAEHATLQGLLKEVMFDPLVVASTRATELGVAHLLPAGFDEWFSHTVSREPSARFPDASQCLPALHSVLAPLSATLSTLPSAGYRAPASVPAAFSATGSAHSATASVPPVAKKSKLPWILAGGALVLVGGAVVVAVGIAGVGYYAWDGSTAVAPPTTVEAPAPTAPASAAPTSTSSSTTTAETARRTASKNPNTQTDPNVDPTAAPQPTPEPTPSSTVVVMNDVPKYPPRDYKLAFLNTRIRECWKGNEGAKSDAGAYSATITVKLSEIGRADSVSVSPRTAKNFSSCATVRAGEHFWGKGPPETKSFSFNF